MNQSGKVVVKTLQDAIVELNEDEAKRLLNEELAVGENPQRIVEEIRQGIHIIGQKYKAGAVGIVELGMANSILQKCLENLRWMYEGIVIPSIGRAVIGTVRGDCRDIGRELFAYMLFEAGFEIYDIGEDVQPERFVEKAREVSANIVVLSGLDEDSIGTTMDAVDFIRKSIGTAKLMVGPRIGMGYMFTIDDDLRKTIAVDAYLDSLAGVGDLARKLVG